MASAQSADVSGLQDMYSKAADERYGLKRQVLPIEAEQIARHSCGGDRITGKTVQPKV
jgi:hypothetical protein